MTDSEFKLIDKRFDTIEKLLNGVNTRLDGINGKVNKHEGQIQEALGERTENRKSQAKCADKVSELDTRVDLLEKEDLVHYSKCPIAPIVRKLEDDNLSTKSIKKWLVGAVAITSTIVGIVSFLIAHFAFKVS